MKNNYLNDPEGEALMHATVESLHATIDAINGSIYDIVFTRQTPRIDAYHPVNVRRENTQTLISRMQDGAPSGSKLEDAINRLQRKMYQKLRLHDFMIERLSILNREDAILSLGENAQSSTKTTPLLMRTIIYPIFRRLGYNMAKIRHRKQLQNHIHQIIVAIEALTEKPFFDKMSPHTRETYELKWKHYVEKARTLGIKLPSPPSL